MKKIGFVWAGVTAALLAFAAMPGIAYGQDDFFGDDMFGDTSSGGDGYSSGGSESAPDFGSAPAASSSSFPSFGGSSSSSSEGSGNVINVPGQEKTISAAMIRARTGDVVKVGPGVYRERVIMAPGVRLESTTPFGAKIDGGGRGTVVTMSRGSSITGFEIKNGTIGIFSSDAGNEIIGNRIVNNWMTGIITVRHLPKIEDNIIAFNRASGIQGWDVRSTAASVNHNSIAYNGNHGIAIGGSSEFIIENNIIAFNEKFGLKILQEPEKIQVSSNNFFRNLFQPGKPLPANNYAFDPSFIAPRSDMNFGQTPGCCRERSANDENLGARLSN